LSLTDHGFGNRGQVKFILNFVRVQDAIFNQLSVTLFREATRQREGRGFFVGTSGTKHQHDTTAT
jgi:hypothetical protein